MPLVSLVKSRKRSFTIIFAINLQHYYFVDRRSCSHSGETRRIVLTASNLHLLQVAYFVRMANKAF